MDKNLKFHQRTKQLILSSNCILIMEIRIWNLYGIEFQIEKMDFFFMLNFKSFNKENKSRIN